MKSIHYLVAVILTCFLIGPIVGCSGNGSGGSTGTLSLSLTDATTNEYKAAYVTIEEVQVHMSGGDTDKGWQVVANPEKTVNLLELVNGVREQLGITDLATGHYTQMRLIIGNTPDSGINILSEQHPHANYIITRDNEVKELKVPSGFNTGIKLVHGFDINEDEITELVLDFIASHSIVKAGTKEKWLLKPVIKVIGTEENSIISGFIEDAGSSDLLEGVLVSAQTYNPNADDKKDEVVIEASTLTDESGEYKLFLAPGTYNVVAYIDGYMPEYGQITAAANAIAANNLALNTAATGTLTGMVEISDGGNEQHVTISIRQSVTINSSTEDIEIKSLNIVNGATYDTLLPVDVYDVVASTFGKVTQEHDISIEVTSDTVQDLSF